MRIRKISSVLPHPHRDFIYDILPDLPLQLAVDVGAAAGYHTRRMRLAGNSESRVVAFEPFQGNHALLEQEVRELDNVTLVRKAVSHRTEANLTFVVPSIVQGSEAGWQGLTGYSSVGFLAEGVPMLKKLKWMTLALLGKVTFRSAGQRPTLTRVEATTLDVEFAGQTIDYLKIDVQGSESDVLRGATDLLSRQAIGIVYVEWPGGASVPKILDDHGYTIFDSVYLAGARNLHRGELEAIGFKWLQDVPLSIGAAGMELVLTDSGPEPAAALRAARRAGAAWIQTDLIAVNRALAGRFEDALQQCAQQPQYFGSLPTE